MRKLTQATVNELIDHIEVHKAEKNNGVWEQRLTIHYNVIGPVTIPEELPLPSPSVIVKTRKGVWVSYAPEKSSE